MNLKNEHEMLILGVKLNKCLFFFFNCKFERFSVKIYPFVEILCFSNLFFYNSIFFNQVIYLNTFPDFLPAESPRLCRSESETLTKATLMYIHDKYESPRLVFRYIKLIRQTKGFIKLGYYR